MQLCLLCLTVHVHVYTVARCQISVLYWSPLENILMTVIYRVTAAHRFPLNSAGSY